MPAYKDESRGTWYVSFYTSDWTGKRKKHKKRGFAKKSDALEYERNYLLKEKGSFDMQFDDFVKLYMEDAKTRVRESTYANKEQMIYKHITPYFKQRQIKDIGAVDVRKWQNAIIEQNFSQTYMKTLHNQLTAIFNYAVRYYDLPKNPCTLTGSIGKKNASSMQIWTIEQFSKVIQFIDDPEVLIGAKTLFWSGMRIGELLALTKKDILFENKLIDVNKSYMKLAGKELIGPPKTPKSKRKILMPDFLLSDLSEYIKRLHGIKSRDRVFVRSKSMYGRTLKAAADQASVPQIRAHDLRHSHASLLIELGYSPLLIAERLGHEKVQTTLETYAHLYPNKQEKVVADLEKANYSAKIVPQEK